MLQYGYFNLRTLTTGCLIAICSILRSDKADFIVHSSTQSTILFFVTVLNFRKGAIIGIGVLVNQNQYPSVCVCGGGAIRNGRLLENLFAVEIFLFRMEWTPVYFFLVGLVRVSVFISTQTFGME